MQPTSRLKRDRPNLAEKVVAGCPSHHGAAAAPVAIGNKRQLTAARAVRSAPEVLKPNRAKLGVTGGVLDNMHLAISESEKAQDSFCTLAFH